VKIRLLVKNKENSKIRYTETILLKYLKIYLKTDLKIILLDH